MRLKKQLLAVVAGAALLAAGCGSDSGTGGTIATNPRSGAGGSGCLADIKKRGELRLGTVSNLPIDAVDQKTGEVTGFNGDMLRAYIQKTGVAAKLKPEAMPFGSLIPALQTDKIDITSDTMFKTPEREQQIAFTNPLLYNPEGLVVKKGNPKNLHQLTDLRAGTSIGTYQGSVWVAWVNELQATQGARAQVFPGINELVQAIAAGQVDGGLFSSAIGAYMIGENPALGVEQVRDYKPRSRQGVVTHLGLAKKCTDLKQSFDTFYKEFVSSGEMSKLLDKWKVTPTDIYLDGIDGFKKP